MALKSTITSQNSITTNHRKSGKRNDDFELTGRLAVVTMQIRVVYFSLFKLEATKNKNILCSRCIFSCFPMNFMFWKLLVFCCWYSRADYVRQRWSRQKTTKKAEIKSDDMQHYCNTSTRCNGSEILKYKLRVLSHILNLKRQPQFQILSNMECKRSKWPNQRPKD